METIELNNISELQALIRERRITGGVIGTDETKVIFNFPLNLSEQMRSTGYPYSFGYYNCTFKENVTATRVERDLRLENCIFEKDFICKGATFNMKVRVQRCVFYGDTNFLNAKFRNLADFWRSTFKNEVIFYKTDFLGTAVFSATIFEKNLLFTYSLIEKLILFRGTEIKNGIDLSTAILTGTIGTFGLTLRNFKAKNGKLTDEEFETAVSKKGEIPIKNKRETFRILKQTNIHQNNFIESIPYQALEKRTLLSELLNSLRQPSSTKEWWGSLWDLFVLGLNWISNSFGRAPMQSVLFTLSVGAFFFYLSITQTAKYEMALNLSWEIFENEIPNFFKFLLPTHGIDYLDPEYYLKDKLRNWYYVWDILGRIFVGFGIYQTIQAFRKFR